MKDIETLTKAIEKISGGQVRSLTCESGWKYKRIDCWLAGPIHEGYIGVNLCKTWDEANKEICKLAKKWAEDAKK